MSLVPGARLGPYEIVAPLGAGGMGEVFRARDSRLARDVAIKVIPEDLVGNPDVRARFEREARASSALNHPNICQVYDVGREGETEYIVMELIEGESLAQRLTKGPLPPPEVLRIGGQIADALDRAHRAGIIHRDLKPGNVMLTRLGAKLLDFGLARPTGLAAGPGSRVGTPSSPTMSRSLTAEGSIVGTFAYMSPEQLEGQEADVRSDLWALGATIYEMATGTPAFEGRSQASLIAAILGKEPRPISELVPVAPPALDRVVGACLAKDPEERIQSAQDVKLQLKWIAEGGSQMGVPAPVAAHRRTRERGAWILAAVSTVVALGALGILAGKAMAPKPVARPVRFVVAAPPGTSGVSWPRLSPDGSMLMFQAVDSSGVRSVWVRPLSSTTAYRIQGTESIGRPFWSPDSKEIGFMQDGKLKKVSVGGGPVQLIAEAPSASDGAWTPKLVLFDASVGDSIRGIPPQGGGIVPASTIDRAGGENQHAWPVALPDGKHFLFQAFRVGSSRTALIRLGTIGSLKSVVVDSSDSRAEFLPPDHLVYVRDGAVIARKFDLAKGRVVGEQIVIGENAGTSANTESFTVADNGAIAFQSNGSSRFVVNKRDRTGKKLAQVVDPGQIQFVSLSPDGKKLALVMGQSNAAKEDLWIKDMERGTQARFTFETSDDSWPVWSPDGSEIAYTSDRGDGYSVWIKPASGISDAKQIPGFKLPFAGPSGYSGDGKMILVTQQDSQTGWNVWAVPLADAGHPIAIANTSFNETMARLSPDGRFVAYSSNPSGPAQIFVQPFPNATARWQLADGVGTHPFWTKNGHEIVYRGPGGFIIAVPVTLGQDGTFQAGTPQRLFGGTANSLSPGRWWPSPDGETFYTVDAEATAEDPFPITVLLDANAELKGR